MTTNLAVPLVGGRDAVVKRLKVGQARLVPPALAVLCAALGAMTIVMVVVPGSRSALHHLSGDLLPVPAVGAVTALTIGLGTTLLLLAHGLTRAKREAWRLATAATGVLALAHLANGRDRDSAVAALLMSGVLLAFRPMFSAHSDPTNRRRVVRVIAMIYTVGFLTGMVIFSARADHLRHPVTVWQQAQTVLADFIGMNGPAHFVHSAGDAISGEILGGFTVLALVAGSYLLLRAAEPAPFRDANDLARLEALLAQHGHRDSLGYFSLREDKSVVFSPSGKAAITYRVVAGVALVGGDPLGDPEAWPGAIAPFLRLCRQNAWSPAVLGCSETAAACFARHGMRVLELGDEAIVEVDTFSLSGRSMRNVRQMTNRVHRAGYIAHVRRLGELSRAERTELERHAVQWRGTATERGFSMALGHLGSDACVVVTAHTTAADGITQTRAVLQFVPWGPAGLSLDLMRRDPKADPGMNEFLISAMLERAASMGIERVSLNFAMFRNAFSAGERLGAGPIARTWAAALRLASRWWQLESLYRFNAKFNPTWTPRYVCYRRGVALPRIGYAAMEAEAFIRRISPLRRLIGATIVKDGDIVAAPQPDSHGRSTAVSRPSPSLPEVPPGTWDRDRSAPVTHANGSGPLQPESAVTLVIEPRPRSGGERPDRATHLTEGD